MAPTARKRPDCLSEGAALTVLDASVAINLIATRCCADIIRAFDGQFGITEEVVAEIERGRSRGGAECETLDQLLTSGLVQRLPMNEACYEQYERLVSGNAAQTLDDGESSTIAYAANLGGIAAIDERKAIRICSERYPALRMVSTVGLLSHPSVIDRLGRERLVGAVDNALSLARMRVLESGIGWVIDLIGQDRAALYPSLPRSARRR